MNRIGTWVWMCVAMSAMPAAQESQAAEVAEQVATLLKVEKQGSGHAAAVPVLKSLEQESPAALIPLLQGIDQANPLAANWLTGAFEAIADRTLKSGEKLPQDELEKFALETGHTPPARRLAFLWLTKIDPTAADRLIPGMLNDPGSEFRREAVQRLLDAATKATEAKDAPRSKELYLEAFGAARDPDQLDLAFDKLTEMESRPPCSPQRQRPLVLIQNRHPLGLLRILRQIPQLIPIRLQIVQLLRRLLVPEERLLRR